MKKDTDNIYGNYYNKYGTRNPIERYLVNKYQKTLKNILLDTAPENILDVGCGEGYITNRLSKMVKSKTTGLEYGDDVILKAKRDYPNISFVKGSVYKIPFDDNSFELVSALELLEHLDTPGLALKEIKRVSSKWFLMSIPFEPLWSILNIIRFKYLRSFGNTPGHINKWSMKNCLEMIKNDFEVLSIEKPLPWIMILCKVKKN